MEEHDENAVTESAGDTVPLGVWFTLAAVCVLWAGTLLGSSVGAAEGYGLGPTASRDTPEARLTKTLTLAGLYGVVLALILPALKPDAARADSEPEPRPLCTACVSPYVEGAHFCPQCGAPLTWFACTGPYESVYAQAWCLGRAKHGPSQGIHVLGLGMLVGAYVGYFLVFLLSASTSIFDSWGGIGLVGEFLTLLIYWLLLRGCLANQSPRDEDRLDPDKLDPTREPYGSPPYWTWDRWWFRREVEADPEEGPPDEPSGLDPGFVPGP